MTEPEFFERIAALLGPLGAVEDDGEEFREPPLDVLRYDRRVVRMHWAPVVGTALSVVATVRQPVDVGLAGNGYARLLDRLSRAVIGRYPSWPRGRAGLVVALTAIVLTPEPIAPDDERRLASSLPADRRGRVVTLGAIRVNLGQEAMAAALSPGPRDLFPEPYVLADGLAESLRRFVPLAEF